MLVISKSVCLCGTVQCLRVRPELRRVKPLSGYSLLGSLHASTHIRFDSKGQPETNTLAYYEHLEMMVLICFITMGYDRVSLAKDCN